MTVFKSVQTDSMRSGWLKRIYGIGLRPNSLGQVKPPASDVAVILDTGSLSPESEGGRIQNRYLQQTKSFTFDCSGIKNDRSHQHTLKVHKDTVGQMSCSPLSANQSVHKESVRTDITRRHTYNMTLVLHTCSMQMCV